MMINNKITRVVCSVGSKWFNSTPIPLPLCQLSTNTVQRFSSTAGAEPSKIQRTTVVEQLGMTITVDGVEGRRLYLDAQESTPLDPHVLDAIPPSLGLLKYHLSMEKEMPIPSREFIQRDYGGVRGVWDNWVGVIRGDPVPIKSIKSQLQGPGINIPPSRIRINISDPHLYRITPMENPINSPGMDRWIEDPLKEPEVMDKGTPSQVEKQAARLIVIRRTKMNKHKLRKLRKRMKYVWAKLKLRRAIKKEKLFLNLQMAKIREAQKFDAKAYVADILRRAKEEPLPTRWEGKYYPSSMIRQKIEMDEKRKRQEYLTILDKRKSEKQ